MSGTSSNGIQDVEHKSGTAAILLLAIYTSPLFGYLAAIFTLMLIGNEPAWAKTYMKWFDGFSRNPEILAELHGLILPALAGISGASFNQSKPLAKRVLLIMATIAFLSTILVRGVHSVESFRKDISAALPTLSQATTSENPSPLGSTSTPSKEILSKLEYIINITNDMSRNTLLYLALLLGLQSSTRSFSDNSPKIPNPKKEVVI